MDIRDYIQANIRTDQIKLKQYRKEAAAHPDLRLRCMRNKKTGEIEYYLNNTKTGKQKYLGIRDCKLIAAIQRKRIAEAMVPLLKHNIKCKQLLLNNLKSDDPDEVIANLSLAYQPNNRVNEACMEMAKAGIGNKKVQQSENPYKREDLRLITTFGLLVRSKGELAIAELLHSLGIEFYYERALVLRVKRFENGKSYWVKKTYYPDFTIVLKDGSCVYWEHEGLISNVEYNESNFRKLSDYSDNNIYVSHNLIITSEGTDNTIDMNGIMRIIDGWLFPLL